VQIALDSTVFGLADTIESFPCLRRFLRAKDPCIDRRRFFSTVAIDDVCLDALKSVDIESALNFPAAILPPKSAHLKPSRVASCSAPSSKSLQASFD
jgi:hypothetical protein